VVRRLARIYGIVAGILLPVVVAAAIIASVRGVDLGVVSRWIGKGGAVAAAAAAATAPEPAPPAPPAPGAQEMAAAETRAWAARMSSLAQEIAAEAPSERGKREDARAANAERDRRMGEAVARVAALMLPDLQAPIAASDWPARADEIVAALEKVRARETGRVSSTLASMDSRALAELIVGSETKAGGAAGLPDSETLALLAGLAPKKAGEVLAAIARRSPDRAAKLAAALVGKTGGEGQADAGPFHPAYGRGAGVKKGARSS